MISFPTARRFLEVSFTGMLVLNNYETTAATLSLRRGNNSHHHLGRVAGEQKAEETLKPSFRLLSSISQEYFERDFAFVGTGFCVDAMGQNYDYIEFGFDVTPMKCGSLCVEHIQNLTDTNPDLATHFTGFDINTSVGGCYCNFDNGQHPDAYDCQDATGPIVGSRGKDDDMCYRYVPFGTVVPTSAPATP